MTAEATRHWLLGTLQADRPYGRIRHTVAQLRLQHSQAEAKLRRIRAELLNVPIKPACENE